MGFIFINFFCLIDVVHRDLKLENILLKNTPTNKTDEFDIRVCDFLFCLGRIFKINNNLR
jgi:serine/threonine protein kinase